MFDDNIAFALMADRAARWSANLPLSKKLAFILPYATFHEVRAIIIAPLYMENPCCSCCSSSSSRSRRQSRVNWRPLMFAKFFQCAAAAAEHRLRAHLLSTSPRTSSHLLSTSLAHP